MAIEGTGIDLVEIARVKTLHGKWGDRFLKKVFTGREIHFAFERKRPYEHLAARFAAKEALIKAIRKKVAWKKMEVKREPQKAPHFCKFPPFLDGAKCRVHLSISHTKTEALALVVIEKFI